MEVIVNKAILFITRHFHTYAESFLLVELFHKIAHLNKIKIKVTNFFGHMYNK